MSNLLNFHVIAQSHPTCHCTGRSLSLKLISQLRESGAKLQSSGGSGAQGASEGGGLGRTFREVVLEEPIR